MASDGNSSSTAQAGGSNSRTLQEVAAELDTFLHGDKIGVLKDIFQKIEEDIQIRRLKVVLGFLACLALFLLFSDGAHFVCDLINFVYPACVVIWAIEQGQVQINYNKWLTYWVLFNTLNFIEYFFLHIESEFWRYYWLWKSVVMSMCFLPLPMSASENVFLLHIKPFLERYRVTINNVLTSARESADNGAPLFVVMFCACLWGFRFLCNMLGFLPAAYMSMISLLDEPEMDRMYWLTYWLVYTSYNIVDCVLGGLPLYYPVKFIFLGIYLLEPQLRKDVYILGQNLILKYKPTSHAYRVIKQFVQNFLTSHHVARANQMEGHSSDTSSVWNPAASRNKNTAVKAPQAVVDPFEINLQMLSPLVQAVLELNIDVELIKRAITRKLARDGPGQNFTSVEALLEAVFDLSSCKDDNDEHGSSVDDLSHQIAVKDLLHIPHLLSNENYNQAPLEVIEENRQLKEQRLCKICMLEEVGMVFVPCGHLVCCYGCSSKVSICPICRAEIESCLRAYMS
ncbi:hypothetical protein BsWGS_12924 [Bradybaena similaris]